MTPLLDNAFSLDCCDQRG